MTFPVTLNPAIHDGRAANGALTDPSALTAQMTSLFQQIPQIIINGAIAFIKEVTGIDLTGVDEFFNSLIAAIENGGSTALAFVQAVLKPLTDALGTVLGAPIPGLSNIVTALASFLGSTNITATAANALAGVANVAAQAASTLAGVANTAAAAANALAVAAQNFINQVVQAIIQGISGIPFVGGSIAAVLSSLTGAVQNQAVTQQNFTISTLATAPRNPAHICRYPVGDVTFSEELLGSFSVFGVTQAASAGTAHTHSIDGNFVAASSNTWRIQQTMARGGYITTSNTCIYDTVAVGGFLSTAGSLNNVFVEVFRVNDDGSMAELFSHDISASFTTVLTYIEVPLTTKIVAEAGEQYMVRVRNATTVDTEMSVAGMTQETMAVDNSIFFGDATDANQTSYTAAQATAFRAQASILPWCMLAAKNAVVPELSFSDDFNRQFLGSDWLATTGLTLAGSQLSYGGTTNGEQTGFYIRRTTMDSQKVGGNIFVTSGATTQRSALQLHVDREGTQSVELSVGPASSEIISYVNNVPTIRAVVATGGTDFYELYYDVTNDKYVARKNQVAFGLEWDHPGTLAKHGSRYRFAGARIARGSGINAALIDNFSIMDFAAP